MQGMLLPIMFAVSSGRKFRQLIAGAPVLVALACGGSGSPSDSSGSTGGAFGAGGLIPVGGSATGGSSGGTLGTGGVIPATGGQIVTAGGAPGSGGIPSTGGLDAAGGTLASGGAAATGGDQGTGGIVGGGGAGTGGGAPACPVVPTPTGGTKYCSAGSGNAGSGYTYELYVEGGSNTCMTVFGKDATFGGEWTDAEDYLARVGLRFNQTQTHQQIGTISAEFAETKTEVGGGLTYIGIYGWTVEPLTEFYILDDWGVEKPAGFASDGTPRESVGTLVADGETYDVWKKLRENKPAITGPSETFYQYFSIRRTARQCGTISVSTHMNEWERLGLDLGKMHEATLLMEAQNNSGTFAFTTAKVTVD
jgi:endo-1,4-beta-xylanase